VGGSGADCFASVVGEDGLVVFFRASSRAAFAAASISAFAEASVFCSLRWEHDELDQLLWEIAIELFRSAGDCQWGV